MGCRAECGQTCLERPPTRRRHAPKPPAEVGRRRDHWPKLFCEVKCREHRAATSGQICLSGTCCNLLPRSPIASGNCANASGSYPCRREERRKSRDGWARAAVCTSLQAHSSGAISATAAAARAAPNCLWKLTRRDRCGSLGQPLVPCRMPGPVPSGGANRAWSHGPIHSVRVWRRGSEISCPSSEAHIRPSGSGNRSGT
jgi:hypothetical protein